MTASPRREVFVFGFDGPTARFEGQLLGALERAESGGAVRIVEVLFLGREADSGELRAMRRAGGAGLVDATIGFRLDESRRRSATRRAMAPGEGDASALEDLGATLGPGDAIVAVLVEHTWTGALGEAVERTGGRLVAAVPTDAEADLAATVLALTRTRDPAPEP